MSITQVAIERNRVTSLALLVVVIAGVMTYGRMPRDEDPGFTIRDAQVITRFPGASPSRVELLVTDKLEKVIQQMPEIEQITSQSLVGTSIITVEIQQRYEDMRPIWDRLRRKVDSAIPDLPEGAQAPEVNDEFGDVFGTVLAITGEGYSYAELKQVADEVRDELLRIDEVAKVEIQGAQEERIFVEYNNARLSELGISPLLFQSILESRNIIISGGSINTGTERIELEPTGNFDSVDELRRTVVSIPGDREIVYLEDLAEIHRGYVDPPKTIVHHNGELALSLAISMRSGGNIIRLGEVVQQELRRLETQYPYGVEFHVVAMQSDRVDKKISEFVGNVLQSVGIVLLSLLVFLGVRTGLVVATLVPMTMLLAVVVMSAFGIGLDQMSLSALIIALGMLVDNAIVMSESIMVRMSEGERPVSAAVASAAELRVPLLTSTLTTAAAFLPIFLAESAAGEYTGPIFKVVTITLLSSWILALTMIPLLCAKFLKIAREATDGKGFETPFYAGYRRMLLVMLRRPVVTVAVAIAVFALTMQLFGRIPVIFFPQSDRTIMTASLRMPPGTPIERTEEVVAQIEEKIAADFSVSPGSGEEGIVNWTSYVGSGAPRYILMYAPDPREAEIAYLLINTSSFDVIGPIMSELERWCFSTFPDLQSQFSLLNYGPPVTWPIEVRISGRDVDQVFAYADDVKEQLRSMGGVKLVTDDWGPRSKKLLVRVNQERAYRAGVTNQDVAVSLQMMLSGFRTTEYREDDEVIPVTMRSVSAYRDDVGKIETLNVYSRLTGQSVPLKQVADLEVAWQSAKIRRRDRLRTVTIQAELESGITANEVNAALAPRLVEASRDWGLGYRWELGGEDEASSEANASIMAQLPVAGFIILLLLITQFNSVRRTAIVLLTIPLGLIGVTIGLFVLRSYFGFMTFLGVISLAGIVINNAIVLLDRIKIEIEDNGLDPASAVIESAQRRLRPILLTTVTTVGGLIPLWLSGGMFDAMAIAIMSGLIFATALTLGIVPVLYSILFGVSFAGFQYRGSGEH